MKNEHSGRRGAWWTRAISALVVLASTQHAAAQGIRQCVDPDFGHEGEGDEGGGGGGPAREDDDALFQLDGMNIWFGTPWDPEFFGFPEWLIPGGPSDDPGDDAPGGGSAPADDAPVDPGYTGTSYEGELTWDEEPECQTFKDAILYRPEGTTLSGQTLLVTLSSKPKVGIKAILLPRPLAIPAYAAQRLGLKGRWSIAAGMYLAKERRVEMRLVRAR